MLKTIKEFFIVFILFFLFFCFIVFPIFLHCNDVVIGDSGHPGLLGELFLQRNILYAMKNGSLSHYYVTDLVNYPWGQNLGPAIANSLHLYFSLPLQIFLSPIASYNLLAVIIFALNGFAMYVLARCFFQSEAVAFSSGFFYMLNSYTLLKINQGFLQKITLFWIPLYLLSLFRLQKGGGLRYVLSAAVLLFLLYWTYAPYVYYALLFTLIIVIHGFIKKENSLFVLKNVTLVMVLATFIIYIHQHSEHLKFFTYAYKATAKERLHYELNGCLDVMHIFRFHPYNFPDFPKNLPLGISISAVALGIIASVKKEGISRFLSICAIIFTILAMGTYFSINGKPVTVLGHKVALPHYLLFTYLPYGHYLAFPIRVFPFLNICFALSLGFGLTALKKIFTNANLLVLVCIFICIYMFESFVIFPELFPPRLSKFEIPKFYTKIKHEDFEGLLDLPVSPNRKMINRYGCYAALSGKKIVNSYDGDTLSIYMPKRSDDENLKKEFIRRLSRWGVQYIIVHKDFLLVQGSATSYNDDFAWLPSFCTATVFYPEDNLIVYKVPIANRRDVKNKTITIPEDFASIQEGIDAVGDGDVILVKAGRYKENIDFKGKAIVLKSISGSRVTVIDGRLQGSVVTFRSGEGIGSVLRGFTICNGSGTTLQNDDPKRLSFQTNGGGILCLNSSPYILGNIIEKNSADSGGGICCVSGASPLIENNVIRDNDSSKGGGIRCSYFSSPKIFANKICNNSALFLGGGIYWRVGSYPDIMNNVIENNSAGEQGGGLYGSSMIGGIDNQKDINIASCLIRDNKAPLGSSIALGPCPSKIKISNCSFAQTTEEIHDPFRVIVWETADSKDAKNLIINEKR